MALRVAINGFGRIGRNILRAGWSSSDIEFVHINDLTSDDMLAYLLHHDSVHGKWGVVQSSENGLVINDKVVTTSSERDPSRLPWSELNVDIVLECTGVFTDRASAGRHLTAGANKVIISAPGKDVDGTFVVGVNDDALNPEKHSIISNASCTTNCLAPMAKVLNDLVGIKSGLLTTVHAYTMDQNILDAPHRKGKFRRSRAASENMVPTSTGAAKAVALVLPELEGRLNGMAIRVPTPNVSLVDLVFISERDTTADEINQAFVVASNGSLKNVLSTTNAPVVSKDLVGNPNSSIIDLSLTQVMNGNLIKVLSWYDNEWGFSNRMLDLARKLAT